MASNSLSILIEALDKASGPIKAIQQSVEHLTRAGNGIQAVGNAISGVGRAATVGLTLPIVAGLGYAAKAAIDFESSMVDVNRALNADTPAAMTAARDTVMSLSSELGVMPDRMAAMVAEAGKLGVQTNQIQDYNRLVAQTGIAWDMSTDQAGSGIARLTNVLGLMDRQGQVNIHGLRQLNSTVDLLADSGATSQAAIVEVLGRSGAATRNFGLTSGAAAGLAAAFLNFGAAPEQVATGLAGVLPQLQTATRQTPKFQAALESLGIEASQFEQSIKRDASGAMLDFVKALSTAENPTAVIADMFGRGFDGEMLKMAAKNYDAFAATVNQGIKGADINRIGDSFVQQQETAKFALARLQSNFQSLAIAIGDALLPAIADITAAILPAVQGMAQFARANPEITKMAVGFALVAAAAGPVVMMVGGFISAVGAIIKAAAAIKVFVGTMGLLSSAGGIVGAIAGKFTALATGISLVAGKVGAIAAGFAKLALAPVALAGVLAGVVYGVFAIGSALTGTTLTFQTFIATIKMSLMELPALLGQVPAAMGAIFNAAIVQVQMAFMNLRLSAQMAIAGLLQSVVSLGSSIAASMAGAVASFSAAWAAMLGAAGAAIAGIVARVMAGGAQVVAAVGSMGSQMVARVMAIGGQLFSAGAAIIQRLAAGIRSAVGSVTAAIGSVAAAVRAALPGSPVKEGVLRVFNNASTNPGATLMSMLGAGIRAYPIARDMQSAIAPLSGMGSGARSTAQPLGASIGAAGGSASIQITNNISANTREDAQAIGDSLEERMKNLFPQLLSQHDRDRARLSYRSAY